jgi:sugar phosphate isomerase/epimerase
LACELSASDELGEIKMDSSGQLSRRHFLSVAGQIGASGLAASCLAASGKTTDAQPDARSPWQIGCYTRPWDKYDYRVALDAIAKAGFKYAGLMTTNSKTRLVISVDTTLEEAQKVGEEVKKRGLVVPSVYGGDIPVGSALDAGVKALKKLIDNCVACGAKNLMMGGVGDEKLYESYYKAIAQCCDYAAEKSLGISIKPHGKKAVELVAQKNFRVWYDPGNILYYSDGKLDPVADAAAVDGLVVGMCIKDYKHPKDVMVTPGTGQVDFRGVMERLKKGGFVKGPLIVECLTQGDLKQTLDEAKKAREFLEKLVSRRESS